MVKAVPQRRRSRSPRARLEEARPRSLTDGERGLIRDALVANLVAVVVETYRTDTQARREKQ